MYDFWDYCNAVRRNVLATTLFIAVVRVNETKFLSNLTLSSFSAGLDFGWGGDVCKRGGWKCMCGCWRFLVVRLCCKPGFRGGPGGNRRVGGGPPLKGGPRHNRPKLLHLHRSPPNTCYARGNSGSSPLPFEREPALPLKPYGDCGPKSWHRSPLWLVWWPQDRLSFRWGGCKDWHFMRDGVQILKNSQDCFGVLNSGAFSIIYFCRLPLYPTMSSWKRLSLVLY